MYQKIFQPLHFRLANRFDFSHVRVRVKQNKIFSSNIIPIYYCGAAQDRRGGSNRLWIYLTYGGRKLGVYRIGRHDTDIKQSVLTACVSYII